MKVFRDEAYKLLTAPIFLIVTALAVLFTLYTCAAAKPVPISDAEYREFHSEVSSISGAEGKAAYIQALLEQEMQSETHDLEWRAHIDFYSAEAEQAKAVRDYRSYLDGIKASAKKLTGISIFADKDSFTYKNALQIPKVYEKVSEVSPEYISSEGVLLALDDRAIDITLMLVLFTAVFILIAKERETGIMGVIKPLKKGRTFLCNAKLILLLLTAVICSVLLYAIALTVGAFRFGAIELSAPMQSLRGYLACDVPISIFQGIVIIIAVKVLTAFLLAMILYLLCTRLGAVGSVMMTVAVIAAEYSLYSRIPFTSKLAPLSGINLITFLDSANMLKTYQSLNLFGYPVGCGFVMVICISIGIAVTVAAADLLFSSMKISVRTRSRRGLMTGYIPKKPFTYTAYKYLVMHKGFVILVIVILILLYSALTLKTPYDPDDRRYKYYCDTVSEMSESEADEFIASEERRFESLYLELISPDTSEYRNVQIATELNAKAGYDRAKVQYEHIKALGLGSKAMFYQTGWNELFGVNGYEGDMCRALVLMSAMCLTILPVIAYDRKRNMQYLINATKHGRLYYGHNILFAAALGTVLAVVCYLPNCLAVMSLYGTKGIENSIRCLPEYKAFADVPIWCCLILLMLARVIVAAMISVIMVSISSASKSTVTSLILGAAVFVLPILIYLIGFAPALGFCAPLSIGHEWLDRGVAVLANAIVYFGGTVAALINLNKNASST